MVGFQAWSTQKWRFGGPSPPCSAPGTPSRGPGWTGLLVGPSPASEHQAAEHVSCCRNMPKDRGLLGLESPGGE